MPTIDKAQITGMVLAGGRGSRMGGVDKGLQGFRGMPLAMHALFRLQPQVGEMMINANRNLAAYESFGVPVVTDSVPDFAGPLAGMMAPVMIFTHSPAATLPVQALPARAVPTGRSVSGWPGTSCAPSSA